MLKGLFNGDSFLGVQIKHFVKEIRHLGRCVRRQNTPNRLLFVLCESFDVLKRMLVFDLTLGSFIERTPQLNNEVDLFNIMFSWKEHLAREDFVKGAPSRPHVDLPRVLLRGEHYFGGAIKASHHVLGQILLPLRRQIATQAKVAYFQVAVFVNQNVGWFEVAVDNVCRVDKFEGAQHLIYKELNVFDFEALVGANHARQVCFHKFRDDVDISEGLLRVANVDHVEKFEHIVVL